MGNLIAQLSTKFSKTLRPNKNLKQEKLNGDQQVLEVDASFSVFLR